MVIKYVYCCFKLNMIELKYLLMSKILGLFKTMKEIQL